MKIDLVILFLVVRVLVDMEELFLEKKTLHRGESFGEDI